MGFISFQDGVAFIAENTYQFESIPSDQYMKMGSLILGSIMTQTRIG